MITENKYVVKGEAKNIPLQAFNISGSEIDLTSATIIFSVKASVSDVSPLFTRKNTAAGGNDNEVEITSASDGLFLVKLSTVNTSSLSIQSYPYTVTVNDGTSYITHSGFLVVQQSVYDGSSVPRTSGTTAQRPTLTSDYADIGVGYFDTDIDSKIWWNGTNWV